ncbi:MAG TPA: RodZ domain-containing protein, partial [Rhizobacter sp.]|nr:RodZ domain-containing protein [Rhizobacter sp.]
MTGGFSMSDLQSSGDTPLGEPSPAAVTAGSLLRQARVAKGLHIAALATSIKVAPRKLELLESDQFDELPGATFTRALAQTVCRSLKIDAAPVLALLPQPADQNLSQMSLGLNAPFRDRPGRREPSDVLLLLKNPVVLGAALLLVASVALYVLPAGWINDVTQRAAAPAEPAPIASVPVAPVIEAASEPVLATTSTVVETVSPASASAPGVPAVQASAAAPAPAALVEAPPAPAPASGVLLLRANAESWVEVIDGRGTALISRVLQPGESVGLDGAFPLRVKIGNASATQVSFKGKAVDLVPTRDNVA